MTWRTMTLPKGNGGLNIIDIRLHNQCLLLKWLWVAIKEPDSLWGSTLSTLGITFTLDETATNHRNNQSQFIRELNNLLPMLRASLTTDSQGTLLWKWTPNRLFSTNSMYRTCNNLGILRSQFYQLWRTHAPPRVLFFMWLLLHDKLNTAENLWKKGWPAIASCALCPGTVMESTDHLFSNCPMTAHILLSTTTATPQQNVVDAWFNITNDRERQRWASAMWTIWKERNARIFRCNARPVHTLIREAREQAALWAAAYDRGLDSTLRVS
jgi:zinc-binding in reverse transcriptase